MPTLDRSGQAAGHQLVNDCDKCHADLNDFKHAHYLAWSGETLCCLCWRDDPMNPMNLRLSGSGLEAVAEWAQGCGPSDLRAVT